MLKTIKTLDKSATIAIRVDANKIVSDNSVRFDTNFHLSPKNVKIVKDQRLEIISSPKF